MARKSRRNKNVEAVSNQIAVDSNRFIPKEFGALESSVFADSNFQEGKLIWGVNYAIYVYYNTSRGMRLHKDKNPQASHFWFEVAKTQYLSDWVQLVQNVFKKEL